MCVDGIFLTAKVMGQILTAIAADGNNQVLFVAFTFIESENTDSWLWFLSNLRISVVQVALTYVSYMIGMLSAITQLQQGEHRPLP